MAFACSPTARKVGPTPIIRGGRSGPGPISVEFEHADISGPDDEECGGGHPGQPCAEEIRATAPGHDSRNVGPGAERGDEGNGRPSALP